MQQAQTLDAAPAAKQDQISGTTHVVYPKNGTIYGGDQGSLLRHGQTVTMARAVVYRSRRGPNQEEASFREEDGKNAGRPYRWLPIEEENDASKGLAYVREDALASAGEKIKEEMDAQDVSKTELEQKISAMSGRTAPPKYLKVESVASFVASVLKVALGITLAFFGAINGLIGQFIGAVSSFVIGIFKWKRSNRMNEQGSLIQDLLTEYSALYDYKIRGKRDPETVEDYGKASRAGAQEARDQKEDDVKGMEVTISWYRVIEAISGTAGSIGSAITGSIVAIASIIPNIIKLARSLAQLRDSKQDEKTAKWLSPRATGILIMVESFIAGLVSLFSLEEAIRVSAGGAPLKLESGYGAADPKKGEANFAEASTTKLVAGYSGAATGGATAIAKGKRGNITADAGAVKKAKKARTKAVKEQVASAKRLRKEAQNRPGDNI